ncbi:MAG: hypothetical protein PUP91_14675 [Rhizonema sp. PD37]|nr:hypothetical protein [Rhizonema sp. PD37]
MRVQSLINWRQPTCSMVGQSREVCRTEDSVRRASLPGEATQERALRLGPGL